MSRLLDPKVLLSIKDLQLAARTTISGFMAGINKSTIKGEGLEFSQYRSYQPGDDLRLLDWKAFARSDRYYIRESEIETGIAVRFVIDASASMNHEDDGITKLQYASYLAACLAWLAALQGDAVGLHVISEDEIFSMDPKRGYQHMARFYHALESMKAVGAVRKNNRYKNLFFQNASRELVIFISDLYQRDEELTTLLDALAVMKHEIIVCHLLADNELSFEYGDVAALEDLETGQQVKINTNKDREAYKTQVDRYLETTRTNMLGRHFFYRMLSLHQPVDQALRDFLKQRIKISR